MGGPYRGKLVEFGETVLAHLPEVGKGEEKDLEIQHQNWQTDGNPACGWERANSQTSTLSEQMMESCMREGVRRLAGNSWSAENLTAVVETPQKPRSMTTDDASEPRVVPEAHEQESPSEEANENDDEKKYTTSQTTRITKWRGRRFQSQTQQQRRAQAEERSAQKHKRTCS